MNNVELINMNELEKAIQLNNKNLEKSGKLIEVIKTSSGNDCYYTKEEWKVVKSYNRNTGKNNYLIELTITSHHGLGRKFVITKKLSNNQVQYIENKLNQTLQNGYKLRMKTRFIYGEFRNEPYIAVVVLFGGKTKYADSSLLDPMDVDVIMNNMLSSESAYDVYFDKKIPQDDIVFEDTNTNGNAVDID